MRCMSAPFSVNVRRPWRVIAAVAALSLICTAADAMGRKPHKKSELPRAASPALVEPESALVKTLVEIRNNRLDAALVEVEIGRAHV